MCSILRSPKHLWTLYCRSRMLTEYTSSVCKCSFVLTGVRHRPNFILPASSFKSSCHLPNKTEKAYSDSSASTNRNREEIILRQLNTDMERLGYDVQKKGRVSQLEIERAFSMVKMIGKVTGAQAFLLIHSCGSFLPEMQKEKRALLVNEIWKTLNNLKCPLDISHYNALLKVHLENEYKFNPVEFLSTMEEQGLEPNRVTYQRLVSKYCQDGDIEGASKILEFMKVKEIPVNEDTFNELINGHAHGNNIEDARKIIDVMRNSQLTPSSSTYASLACGYAKVGDIDNVLSTIQEASSQETYMEDRDILRIIYVLTINGHGHLVEKVSPKLRYRLGYVNMCLNNCLELVNKGYHEIAFDLVKTMPRGNLPDGNLAPGGIFFLRQLVKENLPEDVIIDYCNKMKELGLNEDSLLKATEFAFQFSRTDVATGLLKELHLKGYELRPHYFLPILVSKKGSDEDLYNTLKLMLDLECYADNDTLSDYVFPHLSTNDVFTIVTKLKEIGYELKDIVEPSVMFALQSCDAAVAAELLEKYPIEVHPALIITRLVNTYIKTPDVSSTVKILQHCKENSITGSENQKNVFEQFLQKYVQSQNSDVSSLESLLTAFKEIDVKISRSVAELVSDNLWPNDNPKILSLLDTIVSPESTSEVSEQRPQDQGTKTGQNRLTMLVNYIRQKDVESAEKLMKELDNGNFVYHDRTYNMLIEMYSYHGDLQKALHFKNMLDSLYPDFHLYDHTLLNLATVMVCNKKFDDAVDLIKYHHSRFGGPSEPKHVANNVLRFLNSFESSEEPERVHDVFQMLLGLGYCSPSNIFFGPLVKAFLAKNDTAGAVEEYLRIVQTYGRTPVRYELFKHLVERADSVNLQKVIDASMRVHEEGSVLFTLAQIFVDCGQMKQARKVLETPGLRIRNETVENACESYVSKNMINELEQFLQVTKCVFGLDRERMYYHLLRGYVNAQNVEKALGVWVKLQEEDLLPSNHTMHLLGSFLQRMNQPVPFTIPPNPDNDIENEAVKDSMQEATAAGGGLRRRQRRNEGGSDTTSSTIDLLVKQNELDEAMKLMEKLLDEGKHVGVDITRRLAVTLSENGNTTGLLRLQQKLPQEVAKHIPFNNYIPVSTIKKGQTEQFLTSLETEVFKHKQHFPGGALLSLLQAEPRMLDRVRKLVDVYYKEGRFFPRNVLWIYLMSNKMFEEADQIFECTPEMHTDLRFQGVISEIRTSKDVELSHKLLDVMEKSNLTDKARGLIYSCHIDLLRSIEKTDEALAFLTELKKSFSLKDLQQNVLSRLKRDVDNARGAAVPFVLPVVAAAQASSTQSTSSSSSDSSDSD